MPSAATSILAAMTLLALACAPGAVAADDHPASATDVRTTGGVGGPADGASEYAAAPSGAKPRVPAALRGRWGGAVGVWRIGAVATYDYRNTPAPLASASGPYTGAVITIDHTWTGKYFSGGYRGPVHAGSKIGFGLDAQLSGAGEDLAELSAVGITPTGARVTFYTDGGGIVDLITVAGAGHVSYNVARPFSVLAGARVGSLRVKADSGAYETRLRPNNRTFLDTGESPSYWLPVAIMPFVGAEVFLWNHGSIDLAANFLPGKTEQLSTAPVNVTFRRQRTSLSAALRVFF